MYEYLDTLNCTVQNLNATPEQANILQELFIEWNALLAKAESDKTVPTEIQHSRRILANLQRSLEDDLKKGIETVPAAELFKAISIANASIEKLTA